MNAEDFTIVGSMIQANKVDRNGNFYPQEVIEKAIRDFNASESKKLKEKAIKILKDEEPIIHLES